MTFLLNDNNNKYILKQQIGKGATCKCYLGQKLNPATTETPETIAIKIFSKKYFEFYSNEISLLLKLKNNSNIIKLYEYGQGYLTPLEENVDDNNSNKEIIYYQILEYADNGELKDYINGTSSRIPENISAKIFFKIINTVKYLHENNIVHCDLKPENILLDKYFNPKLNDFGFSQEFIGNNSLLHKYSGTQNYSSPDVRFAFSKGYDGIKNDIFSLGVLLFVMTIGQFPFETTTYSDEKYKHIIKGRFTKFWEFFNYIDISEEFKDLINSLISLNPAKRLSIDKILIHPWITKHNEIHYNNNISLNNKLNNEIFDQDIFDEFNARKK